MNNAELVDSLVKQAAAAIPFGDVITLDAVRIRARMVIRTVFGPQSDYLDQLNHLHFSPLMGPVSEQSERNMWLEGVYSLQNLCATMQEELTLIEANKVVGTSREAQALSRRIFIVHGHDTEMVQAVARTVSLLELEPVILHEQANQGRTIIQKFMAHAECSFAIVLLSPDDMAYVAGEDPSTARPRARQNVMLELGFFLGSIGAPNVFTLYRAASRFEMPSDYAGVLYTPYDDAVGTWRYTLVQELQAVGFAVDANRLIQR